jgi:outer membrane biosynthesis protein TonB
MAKTGRFWRNVVLIALAHVALIAGLIRWSLAARASSNPESIVWLGPGGLAAGESESEPSSPPKPEAPKPSNEDEEHEKKPAVTTAKSEIELPSPTPKPTPTAASTPKPAATATPKPKATPKPIPKLTPKKTLVAKASPKPSPKVKPSSAKANEKSEKHEKSAQTSPDRSGQSAVSGGGSSASEFGWYGNMLHDRFYSAWIQPTTHVPTGAKISTLVRVRIEKDGHVSKFEIIKPSENAVVNESVAAVAKQVTEVDSPPAGLIKGDHYDVTINFELNTEEGP